MGAKNEKGLNGMLRMIQKPMITANVIHKYLGDILN